MRFEPLPISSVVGAFLIGFPALFSIVNPIGSALIFYNITALRTHPQRLILARKVAINAAVVLTSSLWLGSYVLNIFGVSLGALRVAGGLVVAATAWKLLMEPDSPPTPPGEEGAAPPAMGDAIAFFPLTIPITTGPGSIAVSIALASERPASGHGTLSFFAGLTLAALAIALCVWMFYVCADWILVRLGETGARVVSRLSAFLLLCIGVQIIGTGGEGLFASWLAHSAGH
jgi:multiple antibiotic resistance protein